MTVIYMIMLILACLISVEGVALWKLRKCLKSIDGVEDVYIEEHQEMINLYTYCYCNTSKRM